MNVMNNILVIGAHFDDAELGCGGTMAKFAAQGKKVYKLTLTDNVTNFAQMNIRVGFESSLSDSSRACAVLGVQEITDFKFAACNYLHYSAEFMQQVEHVIYQREIDTVFIHYDADANQDHVEASRICRTAARHCKNVFYYQSNGYIPEKPFHPTFFIDISDFYEKKKAALAQYHEEHNRGDRLFETALLKNAVWGYANAVSYAEGFVPLKICF